MKRNSPILPDTKSVIDQMNEWNATQLVHTSRMLAIENFVEARFPVTVPDFEYVTQEQYRRFWNAIGDGDVMRARDALEGLSDAQMREIAYGPKLKRIKLTGPTDPPRGPSSQP